MNERALRIQRLLNSPDWPLGKDVLARVVKGLEDEAFNCDDPAKELRLFHIAKAARLVVRKFENALIDESGAND